MELVGSLLRDIRCPLSILVRVNYTVSLIPLNALEEKLRPSTPTVGYCNSVRGVACVEM
jgi:hypothetical protein